MLTIPADNHAPSLAIFQLTVGAAATQSNEQYASLPLFLTQTSPVQALTNAAPTLEVIGAKELRQFAASARADSQRGEVDWGAVQAAGLANTEKCGDFPTAWQPASISSTGVLVLLYAQLVTPTAIIVHQAANPGYIIRVTVTDVVGEVHTVYEAEPAAGVECPSALVILIKYAAYAGNTVTVYIDQSKSMSGSIAIDAVELVGDRYN
jgi:hypothetical protein